MEELIGLLKQTRLLEQLSSEMIQQFIVPKGRIVKHEKGDYIISAQETVNTVQIILSGKIHIIHLFADGSYSLSSTETPLRVLGVDLIATKTQIAPYHAVAAEPSVTFLFPASIILQPGEIPESVRLLLLNQLLLMVSHLHIQKEYRLAILSRNGLRDRIMIYLSMQAARRGTNSFKIPFSRSEMASFLCVNRSALSHELNRMKKEGIIDFHKSNFTLLQYELISSVF